MIKRTLIGFAICAAAVLGFGQSAYAGEVTGSGRGGPAGNGKTGMVANSNSLCGFSGLEDDPLNPGTVQNWGHTKDFVGGGGANNVVFPDGSAEGCNARDFGRKR